MNRKRLTEVLKAYVAPAILDKAVEAIINDEILEVKEEVIDVESLPDVNDIQFKNNLPDGTMFKYDGKVYMTTKSNPRACEFKCACEDCPVKLVGVVHCLALNYGFEEVDL